MSDLVYSVHGESVGMKFERFPEQARAALTARMHGLVDELEARVKSVVHKRSGKLAAEISAFVDSNDKGVVGKVKVLTHGDVNEIRRALTLEFGGHGTAAPIGPHRGRGRSLRGRLLGEGLVSAYSRRVNIAEEDYLRGPLHEMEGRVLEELRRGLDEAVAA
jgi:hypothetical protein